MHSLPEATKYIKMQSPYLAIEYKSVDRAVNLSTKLSPL